VSDLQLECTSCLSALSWVLQLFCFRDCDPTLFSNASHPTPTHHPLRCRSARPSIRTIPNSSRPTFLQKQHPTRLILFVTVIQPTPTYLSTTNYHFAAAAATTTTITPNYYILCAVQPIPRTIDLLDHLPWSNRTASHRALQLGRRLAFLSPAVSLYFLDVVAS
jgi:hypothetical protein